MRSRPIIPARISEKSTRTSSGVRMKKKTTITSEKHEVWRIRQGDASDSPVPDDVTIDVDQPETPSIVPALPTPNINHTDED